MNVIIKFNRINSSAYLFKLVNSLQIYLVASFQIHKNKRSEPMVFGLNFETGDNNFVKNFFVKHFSKL